MVVFFSLGNTQLAKSIFCQHIAQRIFHRNIRHQGRAQFIQSFAILGKAHHMHARFQNFAHNLTRTVAAVISEQESIHRLNCHIAINNGWLDKFICFATCICIRQRVIDCCGPIFCVCICNRINRQVRPVHILIAIHRVIPPRYCSKERTIIRQRGRQFFLNQIDIFFCRLWWRITTVCDKVNAHTQSRRQDSFHNC